MTKVTYEGIRPMPFRDRVGVAVAVLLGRSVVYEVMVRRGDVICRAVRRVRRGEPIRPLYTPGGDEK